MVRLLAMGLALAMTACINTVTPPIGTRQNVQELDLSKTGKRGDDCRLMVLLFGPFGDASVVNAAKDAGINRISFVDYRLENYIIAYRQCVVVYGE